MSGGLGPTPHRREDAGEIAVPAFGAERRRQYEQGTANRGPRELLVRALGLMSTGGDIGARRTWIVEPRGGDVPSTASPRLPHALDLGAGLGQESEELLRRGWRVTATDASKRMLDATRRRAADLGALDRLSLVHAAFECTELPPHSFDLVHAGFSLPFCPARHFDAVWSAVTRSLRAGGLFAGQFFGPRDEFVMKSPEGAMTSHDADAVRGLLGDYELLVHEEIERDGKTAPDSPKRWHVHHVIARRKRATPLHS